MIALMLISVLAFRAEHTDVAVLAVVFALLKVVGILIEKNFEHEI